MTPKQKAKELVKKFMNIKIGQKHNDDGTMVYSSRKMYESEARQSALICVDRELKLLHNLKTKLYKELGADSFNERCRIHDLIDDLKEVKQEIEKI